MEVQTQACAELVDLLGAQQRGVVHRVAGHREAVSLDRVGEHDRRTVGHGVARPERVRQQRQVVPAEIGDQRRQLVVVETIGEPRHGGVGAEEERAAHVARCEAEQLLVRLVRHRVDVGLQRVAVGLGERRAETVAVLGLGDVPAGIREEPLEPHRCDVGDHPVERLPVEVDHHREVAELLGCRIGDRLPDVALVEFGVADQCDEPGGGLLAEVRVGVAAGQCSEQGSDGTQPDRAGGEVGHVGVLRPRRVRL